TVYGTISPPAPTAGVPSAIDVSAPQPLVIGTGPGVPGDEATTVNPLRLFGGVVLATVITPVRLRGSGAASSTSNRPAAVVVTRVLLPAVARAPSPSTVTTIVPSSKPV